jgi:hypothetical protein
MPFTYAMAIPKAVIALKRSWSQASRNAVQPTGERGLTDSAGW